MKVILVLRKMQLRAREAVFWPRISSDLLQTAQSCEVCQTFSRSQQRETLLPHEVPQGPWLGIDFLEFQSTTYLLIADYYSGFPVIRKVCSTNASATNETLKQGFSEYGALQTMAPHSCQRNLQPLQTNTALTTSRLALVTHRVMVSLNVWCRQSSSR